MARFITGNWHITHLPGSRVEEAMQTGTVLVIATNPSRETHTDDVPFFLRVTDAGTLCETDVARTWPDQRKTLLFRGFISDSYAKLDGRLLDALDPDRTQFVTGSVFVDTGSGIPDTGFIQPGNPAEAEVAGMENWLVEAGPHGNMVIARVRARSEREAARLVGFERGDDVGTYSGKLTPDGSTLTVRFRRLRDLPKWPPNR